jgi:hypothetical protein
MHARPDALTTRREINVAREICFCGWIGELEDREPVYAGDGEWGLACPMCGHLDRLEAWSEPACSLTLAEAARRRERTLEFSPDRGRHEELRNATASSLPTSASAEDDFSLGPR